MLFNSYIFVLYFLPVCLVLFYAIGARSTVTAGAFLALMSLVFYSWWDLRFVPILLGSILWNYTLSLILFRYLDVGPMRRIVLTVAIVGNLALLAYFKYAMFLATSFASLAGVTFETYSIILPIGISFFTFTQIAYLVDMARGQVADRNFVRYVLFVTYFPHLIAGPILHHKEMMPQFADPAIYRFNARNFAHGLMYFVFGLAKKCLIADNFVYDVGAAYEMAANGTLQAPFAWQGALAYTLQLYFDFSGYIDMSIGLSLMFNVRLPLNFNSPYKSPSIIEFWRRWHMTLSRFLRDYLYISLGGNRHGVVRRYANLMITMLLGGLWHGANWTFVAWGALHGFYLVVNHAWLALKPAVVARIRLPGPLATGLSILLTFLCVIVAWVFFRAPDFKSAMQMLSAMAGLHGFDYVPPPRVYYGDFELLLHNIYKVKLGKVWIASALIYALAVAIVFLMPNTQEVVEPEYYRPLQPQPYPSLPVRARINVWWGMILACLFFASLLYFSRVMEFLYFQF